MIKVEVKKYKEIEKQLRSLGKKAPTAVSRAINRAAQNVKSNAVKKVREEYEIKAKDVRKSFDDKKKNKRATRSSLGAVVVSSGKRIGLEKFKVNPKNPRPKRPPKVLKVGVKKSGLKELIGGFVADINGNKVFTRKGRSRLPIKHLFGPAVPQMLDNKDIRRFIEDEAQKTYFKRVEHEIQRVLEGDK